jgi:tetratricopeptide (TPR) repeat protein
MADYRGRVQVIAGFGGLGKSRLALEIAHREKNRRRVWWIQSPRINSGMREVALQLGASTSEVDRALVEVESAADLVWQRLNDSPNPWLLVIDNADDPTLLSAPGQEVSDGNGWLRELTNPNGMVIVTSRDRGEHTWGSWCRLHRISPLEAEDGAWVLMDRAGHGAGTNEQARALSEQLGGLPLALSKAGDYLRKVVNTKVFSGDEVITDFESFRLAAERRFRAPAGGTVADQEEFRWLHAVRSVVDIAFELLTRRGLYEAAPLLKLFACLGVAPIPYHVLLSSRALEESALFSEFTRARQHSVLETLDDFGLIETVRLPHIEGELEHTLTLHPLVQGILREDPDVQHRLDEYYGLNVRIMLDVTKGADPDEPANWTLWNAIAVHAIGVCRTALLGDIRLHDASVVASCIELARLATRYLIAIGLLVPASDLVSSLIVNCAEFGFADSDRPLLGIRHERGRIYIERGNPAEAEKELAKVITLRTAILGFNHGDTLASRHKHARAILEQGRWGEAEKLLRAIVEAERTGRGAEYKDTLYVRHSLARAVLNLGRPPEAEEMLRGILEVYDRPHSVMSPISSEASRARSTLARALIEQKRYAEAEENMRNALSLTPNGQTTAGAFWMRWALVEALLIQGKIHECTDELERLQVDQKEVLGSTHPDTLRTDNLLTKIKSFPNGG